MSSVAMDASEDRDGGRNINGKCDGDDDDIGGVFTLSTASICALVLPMAGIP